MKNGEELTVLGILMQRDAEKSQPDEAKAAATWQAISQAIAGPSTDEARPASSVRSRSADHDDSLLDGTWNPRTAFNPQNAPRASWHYPSRRLVIQALSLVLIIAIFLAAGLVFSRGGFMPGTRPTVTIPEDTIPLSSPGLPSAAELQAYLPTADSTALAGLPSLPAAQQRAGLEAICSRNGLTLTHLPASGAQTGSYWTARREAAGQNRALLLLARETAGQTGWNVVYQLVPTNQALPKGADLDVLFAELLADSKNG